MCVCGRRVDCSFLLFRFVPNNDKVKEKMADMIFLSLLQKQKQQNETIKSHCVTLIALLVSHSRQLVTDYVCLQNVTKYWLFLLHSTATNVI